MTTTPFNDLAKKVYQNALEKGFYEDGKATNMGERLALIHEEVSEALGADRKGKYCSLTPMTVNVITSDDLFAQFYKAEVKGTFEEEMADIVIRVLDMCAYANIDLDGHVEAKMRYNTMRKKYHGKKY